MTTSRMGIIGRRFVSGFSFDVSIDLPRNPAWPLVLSGLQEALLIYKKLRREVLGLTGLF
jgi:hypothetical protein